MDNDKKVTIMEELTAKYPPYTALLFLWLSLGIDKSKKGEFDTTIREMQRAFLYHIGRRPVMPTFHIIRGAFNRLWENGYLDFTTSAWGVSAKYLSEDERIKVSK